MSEKPTHRLRRKDPAAQHNTHPFTKKAPSLEGAF